MEKKPVYSWATFILLQDENGTLLDSDLANMDAAPDAFLKAMDGDAGAASASHGETGASVGLGNTSGVMSFKFLTTNVGFAFWKN